MNNTTNQNNQSTNNGDEYIRMIQHIVSSNDLQLFASNIKKAMTQTDSILKTLRAKVADIQKAEENKKIESQKVEQIKQDAQVVDVKKVDNLAKSEVSTNVVPQEKQKQPSAPVTRTRSFNIVEDNRRPGFKSQDDRRQGGFQRPFDPTQKRNFSKNPNQSRPQGQNFNQGNKPNGFKKPEFSPKPEFVAPPIDTRSLNNKKNNDNRNHEEKKSMNKKALLMRGFIEDESLSDEDARMGSRKRTKKKEQVTVVAPKIENAVITTENLTVKLLAEKIGRPVSEIMKKFLILGMMVNINSTIDFASAELIASELGVKLEQKLEKTYEEKLSDMASEADDEKDLVKRPPIVTVLGHVDHGKTSLLDYIRNTNVIAGEAGGITQHIGAYTIEVNKELVTFIDTPGHAAFTSMRERGAKLTDIAILIVAADDGVMPQTVEAIKHIKQVNVPMIVAINKIDKPNINIDRVKQQLAENDVVPEEWGGDAIIVPIAAKTGQNVDKLIEMILFVAEYQNLRANPKRKAIGSIIEAKLDKGQGPVATVLVQNGTLKVGDTVVAGKTSGKIRAMFNEKGTRVRTAGPSFAVSILGLADVPSAGDEIYAVDDKLSKKVLTERKDKEKSQMIKSMDVSVDSLMNKFKEVDFKYYNVIIKGDVQGSVEALTQTLSAIQNEEVKVKCIHGGVGAINENDVMLAEASNALIVSFNTKQDFKAKVLIDKYKIKVLNCKIIYEVVDFVTKEINKMLTPKYKEVVTGHAEIRVIFKASKVGAIAGSYILDGKLTKSEKARVLRKGKEVYNGSISTIQREKTEVKEILSGFECGIVLDNFSAIEVGDIIEAYDLERIN